MSEKSVENQGLPERKKPRPVPLYNPNDQAEIITEGILDSKYPDSILHTVRIERDNAVKTMDPERVSIRRSIGGEGLEWSMEHMNSEVGRAFMSHGLAHKGDVIQILDGLLTKGFDKNKFVYTTAYCVQAEAGAAIGADHPFTQGGIVLVPGYKENLANDGIKYVVLGEEYNRVIGLLQKKYPKVTFLSWSDAPRVLTEEYNKHTGEHIEYDKVTETNRPVYPSRPVPGLYSQEQEGLPPVSDESEWVGMEDQTDISPQDPTNPDDIW